MNYTKIYNNLIDKAKNRNITKGVYSEVHHIIPRCMGGSDENANLIRLLPEEHFIAHQLLIKIYPENKNLILAFGYMASKTYGKKNKIYGWLRKLLSIKMSEINKGKKRVFTEEHKAKLSESNRRRKGKYSEEHKNKISNSLKGRVGVTPSIETRAKLSKALKGKSTGPNPKLAEYNKSRTGKSLSEEHKAKLRKPKSKKPVRSKGHKLSEETKNKIRIGVTNYYKNKIITKLLGQ